MRGIPGNVGVRVEVCKKVEWTSCCQVETTKLFKAHNGIKVKASSTHTLHRQWWITFCKCSSKLLSKNNIRHIIYCLALWRMRDSHCLLATKHSNINQTRKLFALCIEWLGPLSKHRIRHSTYIVGKYHLVNGLVSHTQHALPARFCQTLHCMYRL